MNGLWQVIRGGQRPHASRFERLRENVEPLRAARIRPSIVFSSMLSSTSIIPPCPILRMRALSASERGGYNNGSFTGVNFMPASLTELMNKFRNYRGDDCRNHDGAKHPNFERRFQHAQPGIQKIPGQKTIALGGFVRCVFQLNSPSMRQYSEAALKLHVSSI